MKNENWISVNVALPIQEEDSCYSKNVIITDGKSVMDDCYSYDQKKWVTENMFNGFSVTHWMPMPEPPSECVCATTKLNNYKFKL